MTSRRRRATVLAAEAIGAALIVCLLIHASDPGPRPDQGPQRGPIATPTAAFGR